MTVDNFKPEIWSTLLIERLQERQDIASIFNREYEQDAEDGTKVRINQFSGVTFKDLPTGDISYDPITSTQVEMDLDQKNYFAVEVKDVDRIQANLDLDSPVIIDAAEQASIKRNQAALLEAATGAGSTIVAGATFDLTVFKEARRRMNKKNVPMSGRWCFLHPDHESQVLGLDNIIRADQYGSGTPLIEGEIGRLLGFRIVISTSVETDTGPTPPTANSVFMHERAVAFAEQKMFDIEAVRLINKFGDGLRGLQLYGTKTLQPDAVIKVSGDIQTT